MVQQHYTETKVSVQPLNKYRGTVAKFVSIQRQLSDAFSQRGRKALGRFLTDSGLITIFDTAILIGHSVTSSLECLCWLVALQHAV